MRPVGAKLTTLVHATEDTRKVSRAIDQVCPALMFEQKLEIRKFRGHYGNEITTLTVSVRKRTAGPFLHRLLQLLPTAELNILIRDLDKGIDEDAHLYLRLDKQAALQGNVRLMDQDPIKCELSFEIESSNRTTPSEQIRHFLSSMIDPR